MTVAIVMPAYNEENTISGVIRTARKYGKVIVVDDASKDGTGEMAKKSGAVVVRHEINRGLGGALRTGFNTAIESGADVVVTIDADGQHNPDEIPAFLEKVQEGYDFVLGERDLSKYPFVKKFGNFWLNRLTNAVAGTKLSDTESGFRAFRVSALKKLRLTSSRYEIAADIIYEVGRNKLKAANVPVSSPHYRKGVGVMDGFKNFLFILNKKIS